MFDRWINATKIEQPYTALREMVLTSKILDSVDKPLYSYTIEQKPTSLDALVTLDINFCEARLGDFFDKTPSSFSEIVCSQATL